MRAAGDARLTLLDAGELPAGWGGKVHALHVGHAHLQARPGGPPEWILSTDADTRHHSQALARALAAARQRGLDTVSLAGWQEVDGLAENLLTPPVFALLDAALGDWERAADGDGPAVANGQFILVREAALARAGGFAALRAVAIDDVALVRRLAETGSRCGFFRAPELLRVRMYRGLGPVYRGWRRNLGGLFGPAFGTTLAALAILGLPSLLLAATLLGALLANPGLWIAAAILWLGGAAASAWLRDTGGHRAAWGLLYPLDALFLAVTLAQGVADWRRGRLLSWKGREVEARGLER
jgi:chlorobactene glucosyltransferase